MSELCFFKTSLEVGEAKLAGGGAHVFASLGLRYIDFDCSRDELLWFLFLGAAGCPTLIFPKRSRPDVARSRRTERSTGFDHAPKC